MRLYYLWRERFTYAGRACASLFLFSLVVGFVANFWLPWVFSGVCFLFMLTLVPSLFMTARRTRVEGRGIRVVNAVEGNVAHVELQFRALSSLDYATLSCGRIDTSLVCKDSEPALSCLPGSDHMLRCDIATSRRGAFVIPRVSLVVPEIRGMLCWPFVCGEAELLVYPREIAVRSFAYLTMGKNGQAFAPLLMPDFGRGLDFVGVREYREGDSLRDLHHKAFARYGRPFTKEFEVERGAGIVLVVDVTARSIQEKYRVEPLIRLAAGVCRWLCERGILGRLFIGDSEIALNADSRFDACLEALARIPRAEVFERWVRGSSAKLPAGKVWSPAARPMGPVLRLGLDVESNPLVHKQVVVTSSAAKDCAEDALFVDMDRLGAEGVSL
jgi:uncharacterized protein (DUF58 family)